MTDEEYAKLAAQFGLAAPGDIASRYGTIAPSGTSMAAAVGSISGRPEASMAGASALAGTQGLTTPGLAEAVRSVGPPDMAPEVSGALNKLIDTQIQYHTKRYAEQQKAIPQATATLQDVDASDEARAEAQRILTQPRLAPAYGAAGNQLNINDVKRVIPNFEDLPKTDQSEQFAQLKRDAYVATLPQDDPKLAALKQYTNLQAGPSWRALQDLGIAHPGITGPLATAPKFVPDIPGTQRADLVSGTPGHPGTPPAIQPAQPVSNAGLNIVRGTEFGEVDRPTRGGYTEPNWDVGARGAKLSGTDAEGVALPLAVLKNYGNTGDKDFIDNFNSKYEVQVVDPKTGKYVSAPLKDYGPGEKTGAGLDMLYKTRNDLGLPQNYSGQIGYRVVAKGSAPPANTTPSVQQTAQQISATGGPVAAPDGNVYIQPIDRSKVKDPSKEGATMSNDDHLLYARSQADDYASAMARANTPLTTEQYQNIFSNFYTNSVKYKDLKPEDLKQPPQEYTDRFAALAGIVSPTGSVITDPDGTNPRQISQLDALLEHRNRARAPGALPGSDAGRLFDATKAQVIVPIARGLFGQKGNLSEGEQRNAEQGLPQWIDSDASAKAKLDSVKAQIQDQMRTIINIGKAQHFDTSAMEQEYRRIYVTGAAAARSDEQRKAAMTQSEKKIGALTPGPKQPPPPQAQPSPSPFTSTTSLGTGGFVFGAPTD
jgi:hypothetical protein